jgi:hypothetical protein
MEAEDGIHLVQDMNPWWALADMIMKLSVP